MNQASTHRTKKKKDRVQIDLLLGLMYFRGKIGVNLHMTDKLFSNESHFVFGAIKPKNRSRFLKGHICFDRNKKATSLGFATEVIE